MNKPNGVSLFKSGIPLTECRINWILEIWDKQKQVCLTVKTVADCNLSCK